MPEPQTIGSLLDTALACETKEEAQRFYDDYRAENEHAAQNLGYIFGYVEPRERRAALYALFEGIEHPIFGGNAMAGSAPNSPRDAS